MGLPAFDIVTVDLQMADWLTELSVGLAVRVQRPHGQERDFIIEMNEPLDNDTPRPDSRTLLGMPPSRLDILRTIQHGLTLARGGHDGFDHTRKTDFVARDLKCFQ